MRRLLNLNRAQQIEIGDLYPWLKKVDENDKPEAVQCLSVSVFDHWLSRDEANQLLENVSASEQASRDALHAKFCALVVAETEVLSFTFRRRNHDRLVFRRFTSSTDLATYCTPGGGKALGHREFHVVLPGLRCAFYESWDDTNHLFFMGSSPMSVISDWAKRSGLHVLENT